MATVAAEVATLNQGMIESESAASLYAAHHRAALRFAYLLTGDHEAAQDITHDAFVRVFSRPRQLRDPDAFPAYLRRTVLNVCFSAHRSAMRERARIERAHRASTPASVAMDAGDVAGVDLGIDVDLWEAVQRLSPRQRAAVVLRFWLDLSEADIASALRCRRGTVKSLLSRGLTVLREEVER